MGTLRLSAAAQLKAASESGTGWFTLWRLAARGWFNRPVLRALAANPGAPKLLLWVLGERRWDVQAMVAGNPRCPRRVQGPLAWSLHWAVRAVLAANPATDPEVLQMLAGGSGSRVRLFLAANPSLTQVLADRLLRDGSPYVRAVAAIHPAASADGLRRLAEGMTEPAWVLRAIAANPSCPPDLSDQLLTWIALGGPGSADAMFDPVECTGHPGDTRFPALAWYREQAERSGAEGHPLWRVRAEVMRVAGRLPGERAQALARDLRPEVRLTIASAGKLPQSIRSELMRDSDPRVARLASRAKPVGAARQGLAVAFPLLAVLGVLYSLVGLQASGSQPRSSPHGRVAATSGPRRPEVGDRLAFGRALPGGGIISCGSPVFGPHTVVVIAGIRGLTLDVVGRGNALVTARGAAVHSPVTVLAGRQRRFRLNEPTLLRVTAGRDGRSSTTLVRCG